MRNQQPRTTIVGNLASDPKVFGDNTENPRTVFTIAVNYGWDHEEREFTNSAFYQIVYFGVPGLNFAESFSKGDRVMALCALGNYTKTAYDEDGDEFNQTLITLNADVAGGSNEFNEIELSESTSKPKKSKKAGSKSGSKSSSKSGSGSKRSTKKDEDADEADESEDEETQEPDDAEEDEAPARKPAQRRSAPARRAPARRRAPAAA